MIATMKMTRMTKMKLRKISPYFAGDVSDGLARKNEGDSSSAQGRLSFR
jgi:hypothetical protein